MGSDRRAKEGRHLGLLEGVGRPGHFIPVPERYAKTNNVFYKKGKEMGIGNWNLKGDGRRFRPLPQENPVSMERKKSAQTGHFQDGEETKRGSCHRLGREGW